MLIYFGIIVSGEDWKKLVMLLIDADSDLLETSDDGESILHKCIHHKDILESIIQRIDRIKDFRGDSSKPSPYELALQEADDTVKSFFRGCVCLFHRYLIYGYLFVVLY